MREWDLTASDGCCDTAGRMRGGVGREGGKKGRKERRINGRREGKREREL